MKNISTACKVEILPKIKEQFLNTNFFTKFSKPIFLADPDLEFLFRVVSRSGSVAALSLMKR